MTKFKFPEKEEVFGLVIGGIVLLQAGSFIVSQVSDVQQLRLGPAFLFILAGLAVYAAFGLINTYVLSGGKQFNKLDLLQVGLIAGIIVAIYVFLPQYVPEIFSAGVQSIRSMVGLP